MTSTSHGRGNAPFMNDSPYPAMDTPRGFGTTGLVLGSIIADRKPVLAIRTVQGVLDVRRAAHLLGIEAPATMEAAMVPGAIDALKRLHELALDTETAASAFRNEEEVEFSPCVGSPEKIICVGFNYKPHADETNTPLPETPILFNKFNNALNRHRGVIHLPTSIAEKFDYEAELVIVIGKEARNVPQQDALQYVFGYCTGNDFTARDLQTRTSQFMLGKTCDGFAPIGPWIVTRDLIPDPNSLRIECRVNGELRQAATTAELIFNCEHLISYASRCFTLKPGDLIFTGTPSGVIWGMPELMRSWLKAGDRISCSVEGLGELVFDLA